MPLLLTPLLLLSLHAASALRAAAASSPRAAIGPRPSLPVVASAVASSSAPIDEVLQPAVLPLVVSQKRTLLRTGQTFSLSLLLPALALASGTTGGEHLHLGQKVAIFFQKFGLPDWVTLMLISMTPAIELRGGVPVGNWMGISPAATFVICTIGNMLPIAPMLLALRSSLFKKLAAPLLKRAEKKLAGLPTGQSRTLALALFVGVPAPGTGAWTGAIIAYLLDMPFGTAMASIFAGVVLAGAIMTTLTLAGKVGALVALGVLVAGGVGAIVNSAKTEGGDEPTAAAE